MNKALDSKKDNPIQTRKPKEKKEKKPRKEKANKIKMFHPADQAPSVVMLLLGYLSRMFVIWIALTGMMLFICDAAGISYKILTSGQIALICAVVTAVFSAAAVNKITFPVVMLGAAGFCTYHVYTLPYDLISFARNCYIEFFNSVIVRLTDVGYTSMGMYAYETNYAEAYGVAFARTYVKDLIFHAVAVIAAVLGIVFVFSIIKRINLPVLFITGSAVCVAIFTYNITSSNIGFALILAALCGILVMKMYETRYISASLKSAQSAETPTDDGLSKDKKAKKDKKVKKAKKTAEEKKLAKLAKKERKKVTFKLLATGGFTGLAITAVAVMAVWIPANTTDDRFASISFINDRMQIARLYVTSYLMGDDVDLNALSLYGNHSDMSPRTMGFESPDYAGTKLFVIDVSYNTPVYLRSWVGTEYDYESGTWYSADENDIIKYRKTFGKDFSPEQITYNFYDYLMPLVTNIQKYDTYKNNIQNGFITMQVNVTRVAGTGYLMYMPSFMNTGIGLLEHNSTEPLSYRYSNYFDGVYTSRLFAANKQYSTVSFVTSMRHDEFGTNFNNNLAYYSQSVQSLGDLDLALNQYPRFDESAEVDEYTGEKPLYPEVESIVAMYESRLESMGITYRGESFMRRYIKMTPDEREAFVENVETEQKYNAYVNDTYMTPSGDPFLYATATEILNSGAARQLSSVVDENGELVTAGSMNTHNIVMDVVGYLADNMTYTLTPKEPVNQLETVLDAFLDDTKEGYCIHFATSAIALLRELGIPARYAEGYIASSFAVNYNTDAPTRYRANVYDYNAHAWFEVYYPGFGWMQYEATPPYMSDMYEPLISETKTYSPPSYTPSTPREPEIIPLELEDDTLAEIRARIIIISVIAALSLIVILTAVIITKRIIRKANKALLDRTAAIVKAKDESAYANGSSDSRMTARLINDAILSLYSALGVPPETGELPSEYARRLSETYSTLSGHDLSYIIAVMEKEEFGYGLTYRELYNLSDYLSDISHAVYSGLNPFEKINFRYFKRVL